MKLLTLSLYALSAFVIFCTFDAIAETGTFTHPTEREDNTLLRSDEIKGYNVYQNDAIVLELPSSATSFELNLLPGTYNINMTTVDTGLRESARSNTLVVVVLAAPKSPALIQIGP